MLTDSRQRSSSPSSRGRARVRSAGAAVAGDAMASRADHGSLLSGLKSSSGQESVCVRIAVVVLRARRPGARRSWAGPTGARSGLAGEFSVRRRSPHPPAAELRGFIGRSSAASALGSSAAAHGRANTSSGRSTAPSRAAASARKRSSSSFCGAGSSPRPPPCRTRCGPRLCAQASSGPSPGRTSRRGHRRSELHRLLEGRYGGLPVPGSVVGHTERVPVPPFLGASSTAFRASSTAWAGSRSLGSGLVARNHARLYCGPGVVRFEADRLADLHQPDRLAVAAMASDSFPSAPSARLPW